MRTSAWLACTLCGGALLFVCARAAQAQPNVEGYWQSETEGRVLIQQVSDEVWIESLETCANGAQRAFIMTGQLQGNILKGMMWRCTDPSLVFKCGHPQIYTIAFTAQVHQNQSLGDMIQMLVLQIRCDYEMEIWNTGDCKVDHNERQRLNLQQASAPTPTPTGTPDPFIRSPCEHVSGLAAHEKCLKEYFGVADWR